MFGNYVHYVNYANCVFCEDIPFLFLLSLIKYVFKINNIVNIER